MKLKFKDQDFQTAAVNAVCELFSGQSRESTTFSLVKNGDEVIQMILGSDGTVTNEYGIGNALLIEDNLILANMNNVQKRHNLPQTSDLSDKNFCVEMETGTGKTMVYSKTILELNKRYGFTKFIIVVPSVAIREGVYKSFEITKEHFAAQYDGVPYRFFIYNSAKLSDVRQFATSANIEIMIINIDAFRKAENIINQEQDKLNGESAMRYIQDTNSVVIIDEPQSVDNTPKAKEAIASLNPLCVLRYSATHREKINTLYRLTPVDAYDMGLVKQICVSSNSVEHDFNKPYIRLLDVSMNLNDNGIGSAFKAKIEIDIMKADGTIERKSKTVKTHDNLFKLTNGRELYDGYIIDYIDCTVGRECIAFTNQEKILLGKAIGAVDENQLKRAQIRRTIETHLDKELRYIDKGIKVLSLFFIDEVKKYRTENGGKGIYAEMFEECYNDLIKLDKYAPLKEKFPTATSKSHDGYFSQDKKGLYKNTKGDTIDDHTTYNTIMKDKEWLLSFECPLRFIFSHSALKEGWDNNNVFQVCTLLDQKSTFTARQKIGRGLRLCVNQNGERIEDKDINILHVMANESFAEFANNLQKEIEQESGVKFGVMQLSLLTGLSYTETKTVERTVTPEQAKKVVEVLKTVGAIDNKGNVLKNITQHTIDTIELPQEIEEIKPLIAAVVNSEDTQNEVSSSVVPSISIENITGKTYTETIVVEKTLTYEDAVEIMAHAENSGHITKEGKITKKGEDAIKDGTFAVPDRLQAIKDRVAEIANRANRKPPIRDASKDVVVRLKKQIVENDPVFKAIWERIEHRTSYRLQLDTEQFVKNAVKKLKAMPVLPKAHIVTQVADILIQQAGVGHREREIKTIDVDSQYNVMPNATTILRKASLVPKKVVKRVIDESGRGLDFINNPQMFIEKCTEILIDARLELSIEGIKYVKLTDEKYGLELFDSKELLANLDKNAVAVERSVYDHVIYDNSAVEKSFAKALDDDPEVKLFFKMPRGFKIDTPIGAYNPDWCVYMERNGEEKLYFVLETKGSTSDFDLRLKEILKIECGKRHFEALENDVELRVADNWGRFKKDVK